MVIKLLLLTAASSILYRLGGLGRPFNTKFRDMGCPLASLLGLLCLGINSHWYIHFISFGLMFGALTTYWDKLFKEDNFWFHGAMVALAYFPYSIVGAISWHALIIRVIVLGLAMGWWCEKFSNVWVEECGRGAFIMLTLPLCIL